jgi:hypothetical protein
MIAYKQHRLKLWILGDEGNVIWKRVIECMTVIARAMSFFFGGVMELDSSFLQGQWEHTVREHHVLSYAIQSANERRKCWVNNEQAKGTVPK